MSKSGVFAGIAVIGVLVLVVLGAGTVFGVGPLAPAVPAEKVTDPKEMLARSLQATLDASAVRLDGTISGTIPGALVERPEAAVNLDGTTVRSTSGRRTRRRRRTSRAPAWTSTSRR